MKKKFFHKCLISIGFFLLLTLLLPQYNVKAAGDVNQPTKNVEYRLITKSITLVKGKSFALKIYNLGENAKVSYKSNDPEIASVSEDGLIIACSVGKTFVTATIKDGETVTPLTCDVLVGPPAFSVKITKSRVIIGLDNTDFLNVILKPSNTFEDAKFSSYDPSIVSVSPGGRITAKKLGLTYVFAQIEALNADGSRKFDTCTVIVTKPEDAPSLEAYFTNHPELVLIPESDLQAALDEFFNVKYDPSASASLVDSLNRYLDDKFNLAKLRKTREENLSSSQSNSAEVISSNTAI